MLPSIRPFAGPVPATNDHDAIRAQVEAWDRRDLAAEAQRRRPPGPAAATLVQPRGKVFHRAASNTAPWRPGFPSRAPLATPEDVTLPIAAEVHRPPSPGQNLPTEPPLKPLRAGASPLGARDKERLLLPHLETLSELTGRMTRHTGLRGWWRKRFGPKPTVPGNEVLAMAERIGVPLMQALQQRQDCGADIAERQMGVLLGEWFGQTFKACRPASGKHWRQRVSHRGNGVFAEAWRLARSGCERSGRAPDGEADRRMKAVATMCVLNALHSAPLRS